jgi:type II secretory pathway component PulL
MGIKFLTALAVFLFTELLAGKTHAAESIRRNWHFWLNVTLTLGFFTVVLGSMARSLSHNPKHAPADSPAISAPANTATT